MNETITIFCSCPDLETAKRLSRGMIENRHAACVNIIPTMQSVYFWEGEIKETDEVLMIIKTTHSHFFVIEHWLEEHHPYEVPELLALDAEHVSEPYLAWIRKTVST